MNTNNLGSDDACIVDPNDRDNHNRYLLEVAKYNPNTREEEIELFKRIEAGDEKAVEIICKNNLRFVISVAKRYRKAIGNTNLTLEDLISEGNIGLIVAIGKFDYNTGNKFISYAVWWIKSYIRSSIQNNIRTIRITNGVRSKYNKIKQKQNSLNQELSREPSIYEVLEALINDGDISENESESSIDEIVSINSFEKSLNTIFSSENTTELIELLESDDELPYDIIISDERKRLTYDLLKNVPIRIRIYIIEYFGLNGNIPLTIKELSEKYELSQPCIRQHIVKNLRKLRYKNKSNRSYFFSS